MCNSKVLIVILNYKTYNMTLDLIEQLKVINYASSSILVIDNCSPNESALILGQYAEMKGYIFYKNDRNSGYASGNNIGIRYAVEHNYDYTLILNSDVKVTDYNFIDILANVLDENDEVSCVGPKIINSCGNVIPPYSNRPNLWTMTLGLFAEKKRRINHQDNTGVVYRLFGCCMLLRNKSMKQVDYMDERTFLYYEEEILAEKLLLINKKNYYCSNTQIVHMESSREKSLKSIANKIKNVMDSMEIYLRDYRKYSVISRKLCKIFRIVIICLKG